MLLTSTDGFHWIEQHRIDDHLIINVAWDGSRFVATVSGPLVLLSSNGSTWTEEGLGEEIGGLGHLVWDGSRFIAIGTTSDETRSFFTSEDALTWQSQPNDCECYIVAIAWGNGRYVVVGGEVGKIGTVLTSIDASTWEEQSWEGTGIFNDVIFGSEGFVAVGARGLVATSPDGHIWSFQDPPTNLDLWGVTETDAGYLVVGEDGFMMTSPDRTSWQELSEDSLELPYFYEILEMASGDGVVIGVGTNSLIVRSKNGGAWETRPHWVVGNHNSVCRIGSDFWAVGDHGIVRSSNGLEWDLMLYDTDIRLFDVAWNGSVYVAVGKHSETGKLILSSTDGVNWQECALPETEGSLFSDVAWTGTQFHAVGRSVGERIFTSTDGLNWSTETTGTGLRLVSIGGDERRLYATFEGGRIIRSNQNPPTPRRPGRRVSPLHEKIERKRMSAIR